MIRIRNFIILYSHHSSKKIFFCLQCFFSSIFLDFHLKMISSTLEVQKADLQRSIRSKFLFQIQATIESFNFLFIFQKKKSFRFRIFDFELISQLESKESYCYYSFFFQSLMKRNSNSKFKGNNRKQKNIILPLEAPSMCYIFNTHNALSLKT